MATLSGHATSRVALTARNDRYSIAQTVDTLTFSTMSRLYGVTDIDILYTQQMTIDAGSPVNITLFSLTDYYGAAQSVRYIKMLMIDVLSSNHEIRIRTDVANGCDDFIDNDAITLFGPGAYLFSHNNQQQNVQSTKEVLRFEGVLGGGTGLVNFLLLGLVR